MAKATTNKQMIKKDAKKRRIKLKPIFQRKVLYVTSIKIYSRRRLHIYNFLQYKLESMKRKAKKTVRQQQSC